MPSRSGEGLIPIWESDSPVELVVGDLYDRTSMVAAAFSRVGELDSGGIRFDEWEIVVLGIGWLDGEVRAEEVRREGIRTVSPLPPDQPAHLWSGAAGGLVMVAANVDGDRLSDCSELRYLSVSRSDGGRWSAEVVSKRLDGWILGGIFWRSDPFGRPSVILLRSYLAPLALLRSIVYTRPDIVLTAFEGSASRGGIMELWSLSDAVSPWNHWISFERGPFEGLTRGWERLVRAGEDGSTSFSAPGVSLEVVDDQRVLGISFGELKCPRCGKINSVGSRYCRFCGERLG